MTPTDPPAASPGVQIPTDGKELYDSIMKDIEPDLLMDVIPTLDAKYAGETPEQNAERQARYQKAFTEYDKRYADAMAALNSGIRIGQHKVYANVEKADSERETQSILTDLESSIASAT